jgi:undecaprenyl diphosphate synthase
MNAIRSIGIIMDGNRRWAKAHGVSTLEGHRAGFDVLKKLAESAPNLKGRYGLEYITFYAFSTENWNRTEEEVGYLMKLFEEGLRLVIAEYVENGKKNPEEAIRIKCIGQRERFSPALQKAMIEAESATKDFGGVTAVFALSYGGRAEILEAVQKIKNDPKTVTEETFSNALWTAGIPDPDIIIRTGGEQRLSNFLLWQNVYSELFFPDTLWPDFTAEELEGIFKEFQNRQRRHGT